MSLVSVAKSKLFVSIVVIIGELILCLAIFRLGMIVGFRKANFSYRWGENYHHLFGAPRHGWWHEFEDKDDYINSSSVVGSVLQVASSTLIIRGNDRVEKSVEITSSTIIQKNRQTATAGDIQADDQIMVIGAPSSTGQLEAKFIRVFNAR